jgi:hypothetical protein
VINCLLFALLAFFLAANWWIALNNVGLPTLAWLASGFGITIGLFAVLIALSAAFSNFDGS